MPTVLIANRGEIACRIIRSAQRLGLRTVALYSDADASALHTQLADASYYIGASVPTQSYLNVDAIMKIAYEAGVDAIHPGYGFLAENADFAQRVEAAGMIFVGPTPSQLEQFGTKHTSRELAREAGVPLNAGTDLLETEDQAKAAAERIGYPVMLKATGGGGGIGIQACYTEEDLCAAFAVVTRLAEANFSTPGVFLEHLVRPARHVEVQIFGDGLGNIAVIGDRDCSLQRRNQKVIEEAPAPALPETVRQQLHRAARSLGSLVRYSSAGTVEFIYDPAREQISFLEVNARLQVEHTVTEEVYGIDLVEKMFLLALEGPAAVSEMMHRDFHANGVAVEARIYAEDPNNAGRPSTGLITRAVFPAGKDIRIDTGIIVGQEVSPYYDPMIAKIIVHAPTREQALSRMYEAVEATTISGVTTNIGLITQLVQLPELHQAQHSTITLESYQDTSPRIEVISGGTLTTVQDLPGRLGYWNIGIPPSGPMDDYSSALANHIVGNHVNAPVLETTMTGPVLRFSEPTVIALTGAVTDATLDGTPLAFWEPISVKAGQTLKVGTVLDAGLRTYIAMRGGVDVPHYLGSASTFILGKFGGHAGRPLAPGDVLKVGTLLSDTGYVHSIPLAERPDITHDWYLGMLEGPQASQEFLTHKDRETFFSAPYTVHFNVDRTGVRLTGPVPEWSREDGGEAGLHPSNVHDNPYVVGAVNLSGNTPIILGVDGPSLGGFICPAVLAPSQRWKMGQLKPGDTVHFVPITEADARPEGKIYATSSVEELRKSGGNGDNGIIAYKEATGDIPRIIYRRAGIGNILVEYGEPVLDLGLRLRVYALEQQLIKRAIPGIEEKTPGIRSLLIGYDPHIWNSVSLVDMLLDLEKDLGSTDDIVVPSRTVKLPLSWDDDTVKQAVDRYISTVRHDAPWLPWNIEFIRRINGLDSVRDVYDTVFSAEYMVMGLGDVYLGAPVATPLDPRHRLMTTKYNPARTFTADNAVGIGGAFLCVYGLEGPGGYQLIGQTVPIFSRYRTTGMFAQHPWALRFFDRISWYEVTPEQLRHLRREVEAGRGGILIEEGEFSYRDYREFLAHNAKTIAEFETKQRMCFEEEKQRWKEAGEFDTQALEEASASSQAREHDLASGAIPVVSPIMAGIWKIEVHIGQAVTEGQVLFVLEAMKMETAVLAPASGVVTAITVQVGNSVVAGQIMASIVP